MVLREGGLPLGQDPLPGPAGHEHADPPPLVENALVHQQTHPLGRRGRIDGVELGQVVGAGDLLLLQKDPPQNVRLDHLADLEVDGLLLCQALIQKPPLLS